MNIEDEVFIPQLVVIDFFDAGLAKFTFNLSHSDRGNPRLRIPEMQVVLTPTNPNEYNVLADYARNCRSKPIKLNDLLSLLPVAPGV